MEERKSVSFDVKMDAGILYDYQLYHAYTSASGLLGTCFGILGILMFIKQPDMVLYLILGIMLIFYTPVTLRFRCAQAMQFVEAYKMTLHYTLDAEGIHVSTDKEEQMLPWENFTKAVSTPKSIVVYSGKKQASIFPRKALGEDLPALLAVISENMKPSQVKIRQ